MARLLFLLLCIAAPGHAAIFEEAALNSLLWCLNAEDAPLRGGDAATEQPLPDVAFLSLGERCSAALNFKWRNISTAYYPFDFIVTPLAGLQKLLATRFQDFITQEQLVFDAQGTRPGPADQHNCAVVFNKKTNCEFRHDFSDPQLSNYHSVAKKYQRRIERFYQTIEHAKHIYFFRTHLNRRDAAALQKQLQQLFPHKSFTLVAPTDPKHVKTPWRLKGVREFLMYKPTEHTQKVHGSKPCWDAIFNQLSRLS